jgi:hypothetical protein
MEQDKERDKIFTILGELDQKRHAVTGSRHMIEIGSKLLIGPTTYDRALAVSRRVAGWQCLRGSATLRETAPVP